jgi:hypothetical protein
MDIAMEDFGLIAGLFIIGIACACALIWWLM